MTEAERKLAYIDRELATWQPDPDDPEASQRRKLMLAKTKAEIIRTKH